MILGIGDMSPARFDNSRFFRPAMTIIHTRSRARLGDMSRKQGKRVAMARLTICIVT
jgi:hypothetical protein